METWVRDTIEEFVQESPANRYPDGGAGYFEAPLVGFAAADDPLFGRYKQVIGEFHLTPHELLGSARTVICWVLPVNRAARESNRRETAWPSREWALTRDRGEAFNTMVRRQLVGRLEAEGWHAVAPQLSAAWHQLDAPVVGIASSWSERHAAYAAGLGTFSLNDGLITPRGIAHRLGSVITDLPLCPTTRTAPDFRHNCLYYREQTCGACVGRCPVGALSLGGHDKERCRSLVYGSAPEAVGARYGVSQTGCGLCQTRVPCEAGIPPGKRQ